MGDVSKLEFIISRNTLKPIDEALPQLDKTFFSFPVQVSKRERERGRKGREREILGIDLQFSCRNDTIRGRILSSRAKTLSRRKLTLNSRLVNFPRVISRMSKLHRYVRHRATLGSETRKNRGTFCSFARPHRRKSIRHHCFRRSRVVLIPLPFSLFLLPSPPLFLSFSFASFS